MKKKWISKFDIYKKGLQLRDLMFKGLAKNLSDWGVSANILTFSRLLLMVPLLFMAGAWPFWALLILLVNWFLDSLDGVVARIQKKESVKGRTFDVCVDNFYIVPVVLGLLMYNLVNSFWAAFYLVGLLVNYFANYIKYGIDVGKYPFSFSKYFVYLGLLTYTFWFLNIYDYVFIFWSIFLLIENSYLIYKIYKS